MTRSWAGSPATWVDGTQGSGGFYNQELRDRYELLQKRPYCLLNRTFNETQATPYNVIWEVEQLDTDGIWSGGSPTRLTVPTGYSGLWTFDCQVTFEGTGATSTRRQPTISLQKNGGGVPLHWQNGSGAETAGVTAIWFRKTVVLAVADYISLRVETRDSFDRETPGASTWIAASWRSP